MKYRFSGIDCTDCCLKIENNLKKLEYIKYISLSFQTKTMIVEFKNDENKLSELIEYVKKYENNFKVEEMYDFEYKKEYDELNEKRMPMYVGLGLFFIAFFIDKILYWFLKLDSDLKLYFTPMYIIVYIIVGYPVLKSALSLARRGNLFNEKTLMSVSTIAAFLLRDYAEASAVMLFYTVGEYFQELSVLRSRRGIRELLENQKTQVHILDKNTNEIKDKNLNEINIGDIIYVKNGERIEFDGEIYVGNAVLDTSFITGEAIPKVFKKGESVFAGMVNLDSPISIKVSKRIEDSSINRIIEMVENSTHNKSDLEKFLTKFSNYYTPIVFALALFSVLIVPIFFPIIEFKDALYNAITLLVVSCPCALVLSVPLTYFSGVARATKAGILIKRSNVFDDINKIDKVFLDKTGTITEGKFKVNSVYENLKDIDMNLDEIYKYVYNIEKSSNHPIAKSIVEFISKKYSLIEFEQDEEFYEYLSLCEHCGCCHEASSHFNNSVVVKEHNPRGHFVGDMCENHIHSLKNDAHNDCGCDDHKDVKEHNKNEFNKIEIKDIKEILGKGISANVDGNYVLIGSKKLLLENNINLENNGYDFEKTKSSNIVYVSINGVYVLSFVVKDKIKNDSKLAILEMKKNGIKEVVMLTGDNDESAKEVSYNLGIDRYYSNLLPEDKLNIVLKENSDIVFIGDGINDAPALANSKIGVAMGKSGQDIAIETADVVFSGDSLMKLSELKKLSKIMSNIIIQNLTFILLVKIIVILFGMFSFISMWFAVFADVGVTIIAVINSMRVRNFELR